MDNKQCEYCDEMIPEGEGVSCETLWPSSFCCDDCMYEAQDDMRVAALEERYEGYLIDGVGFADPGGRSALRAATYDNPRNLPCPSCGGENLLTPADRARGYQCNYCADQAERGW